MRVTQQDIAKLARVSQATVSRVLAGDQRVEARVRDRVKAVILEHNYQPDVRARSLRSKSTGLIGLVVRRPSGGLADDPFFNTLIAGIMDFLAGKPFHLCVDMVTDRPSEAGIYEEMLRTRRVDGLILVESQTSDQRILRLQRDRFPFVLIGNPCGASSDMWSVDNDNVYAGKLAAQHLLDVGYERIGMLAGPEGLTVSDDRIEGYRMAMHAAGLPERVWHSEFGHDAAFRAARALLSRGDRPDALVVLDDYMALGVAMAARELLLHCPEEFGLVSFNDSTLCRMVPGGLSSVSLNIPEIVRMACGRLLRIVDEPDEEQLPRRVIVPCELKARGSTLRQGVLR